MPVESCLYYLERPTENRPISIIRTLQGHDPIMRWPARSSSYRFSDTPCSVTAPRNGFYDRTGKPASLQGDLEGRSEMMRPKSLLLLGTHILQASAQALIEIRHLFEGKNKAVHPILIVEVDMKQGLIFMPIDSMSSGHCKGDFVPTALDQIEDLMGLHRVLPITRDVSGLRARRHTAPLRILLTSQHSHDQWRCQTQQ